jgi:HSP90 family molecular chaperone
VPRLGTTVFWDVHSLRPHLVASEEEEDEDEEADDEPKTKTVKKTVFEWDLLNDSKALWLRSAGDVEDEEYQKFWKALSKSDSEPMAYSHFRAEVNDQTPPQASTGS